MLALIDAMLQKEQPDDLNFMLMARYGGMIAGMSVEEAKGLMKEIDGMEDGGMNVHMGQFVKMLSFLRWSELAGPEAMAEFVNPESELISKKERDRAEWAKRGMLAWTEYDPDGARSWVEKQVAEIEALAVSHGEMDSVPLKGTHDLFNDEDVAGMFLKAYIEARGEKARELFNEVKHGEIRASLKGAVLSEMAEQVDEPEKLKELIQEVGPDDRAAKLAIINKLAISDNESARRWVDEQEPSQTRDHMVTAVAMEWLKNDPANAAEWYLKQEMDDPDRDADRLGRIYNQWSSKDPERAVLWLKEQPDNASRDEAEFFAANGAAYRKDYTEAIEWVSGIQEDEMRERSFEQILETARDRRSKEIPEGLIEAAEAAGFKVGE